MKPKPELAGVTLLRLARWGWLVAVLFLAGCAADRTPTRAEATPELTLTETATIRPTTAVPSRTPTVTATTPNQSTLEESTIIPEVSGTTPTRVFPGFELSQSEMPTPQNQWRIVVESGDNGTVVSIKWSDESNVLLYAMKSSGDDKSLSWVKYDIETRQKYEMPTPEPLVFSRWGDLVDIDNGVDPSINGQLSPSGRKIIYTILYGQAPLEKGSSVETWIANLDTNEQRKISQACCKLIDAAWFSDESKVVFSLGYEGPPGLFIADATTGQDEYLAQVDEYWALSPTNDVVALFSYGDMGRGIIFLNVQDRTSRQVDKNGSYPFAWSPDGENLIYWATQPENPSAYELRKYNVPTGKISRIISSEPFERIFGDWYLYRSEIVISPDNQRIALWSPYLWVINLME